MSSITRRAWLKLLGAASTGALLACDDKPPPADAAVDMPAASNCATGNAKVTIGTNHVHGAHELVVSSADVQAGLEKAYDVMGMAIHTHTVTVTAADFVTLQGGGMVMITSTVAENHMHVITISCA